MNLINALFGVPLGYVMYFCYIVTQNYGLAIILFTILVKIILFPVSIAAQKNSIKMVRLQPKLEDIKKRYSGDNDKIAEEQSNYMKNEKYNPAFGLIPILIQIPLIFGLINVIYNPLQHLLHFSGDVITSLTETVEQLLEIQLGWGGHLEIIDAVRSNPVEFMSIPNAQSVISSINGLDLGFCGLNLALTPNITRFDAVFLVPVFSGLSALLLCLAQNKIDVLQKRQSELAKWLMTLFMIAFSTYFAFIVPAGVGLYWIVGNLSAIVVLAICNRVYAVIDTGRHTQKPRLSKTEKRMQREKKRANRIREKADNKRFYSDENDSKQLVFYSEASGFYKYFSLIIEYITANSDITIHYVTSDPDDKIFNTQNKQIVPYYIGARALISFMMQMDADMVVMTMPDLGLFHIKRSLVRKDIEYVFTDHGMTSIHMMYRKGALNHYDTIFCNGPNHIEEIRETERVYGLPPKKLISVGYGLLDEMLEKFANISQIERSRKQVLVAPSWQADNIMELCLEEIVEQLADKDLHLIIRPHPEFVKRFPDKMQSIVDTCKDRLDENFIIQTDFSSNETVFQSDLVITDWSSIAQEFSYSTKKPSLFINTPMKVMNPEYERISCVPLDISLRDEIGISIDTDKLNALYDTVKYLTEHYDEYREKISLTLNRNIFNIGHSNQVAGDYIITALADKAEQKEGRS